VAVVAAVVDTEVVVVDMAAAVRVVSFPFLHISPSWMSLLVNHILTLTQGYQGGGGEYGGGQGGYGGGGGELLAWSLMIHMLTFTERIPGGVVVGRSEKKRDGFTNYPNASQSSIHSNHRKESVVAPTHDGAGSVSCLLLS